MKPLSHFAELAPIKVQPVVTKPRVTRVWVKIAGKLECRWVEER